MNLFTFSAAFFLLLLAGGVPYTGTVIPAASDSRQSPGFRVSSDFENGSALILAIDSVTQTVRITPAGDATRGMPVWWHLRIDGISLEKPVTLEVVANEAMIHTDVPGKTVKIPPAVSLPWQASFSINKREWFHTETGVRKDNVMTYRLTPGASTLWLAWGPPFTAGDAVDFIERTAREYSFARAFTLCLSREKRPVHALRISEGDKPLLQRPAVWVQARQHAWECGSSWVATGFCGWLTGNDEAARWLRQNADLFIVPIMDIDHVATGDGGKNALPQDHNRDWTAAPHWSEVAAAQQHILRLAAEKRLAVFLDLHNPGPAAQKQAVYVTGNEYIGAEAPLLQEQFLGFITEQFGSFRRIESKPPAVNPQIFYAVSEPWVAAHGNPHTIGFCIETPWNTAQGTVEGYKTAGEKIARAIAAYLKMR